MRGTLPAPVSLQEVPARGCKDKTYSLKGKILVRKCAYNEDYLVSLNF